MRSFRQWRVGGDVTRRPEQKTFLETPTSKKITHKWLSLAAMFTLHIFKSMVKSGRKGAPSSVSYKNKAKTTAENKGKELTDVNLKQELYS